MNLFDHTIEYDVIYKLSEHIKSEKHDTESLGLDIKLNGGNGNIAQYMNDKDCMDIIISMYNESQQCMFCVSIL